MSEERNPQTFYAKIQKNGRISIPKPTRNYLNLEEGGTAVVTVKPKD